MVFETIAFAKFGHSGVAKDFRSALGANESVQKRHIIPPGH